MDLKKKLAILFFFIGFSNLIQAQRLLVDTLLAKRIDSLYAEAKKYRALSKDAYTGGHPVTAAEAKGILEKLKQVDISNNVEVRQIIANYGYPGYTMVGNKTSHNFWIMLQFYDQDMDLQTRAVPLMKKEVDKGNAAGEDYAYLVDRFLVNKNEPQIYGTQIKLNDEHTTFAPQPMIEPEKVDERRKQVGLRPIAEYIQSTNARYYKSMSQTSSLQSKTK